jgi:hypothetical protein
MTDTLPPLPMLPQKLLARIGEYGLARTDGVGDPERLHRWQLLIDGIKEYAADYARAALPAAQPVTDGVAVPREPLPAETAQPMFASHVGRRKWEQLQGDGFRMQRIHFARSVDGHERRGTIDPWGKVLWETDAGVGLVDSSTLSRHTPLKG